MRIFSSIHLSVPQLGGLGLGCLVGVAAGFVTPTAIAQTELPVAEAAPARVNNYNLPAQGLEASLAAFARLSGIQVVYEPSLLSGLNAPAVQGRMTEREALARLLGDAHLEWSLTAERTLVLSALSSSDAFEVLPTLLVATDQNYERADGPVQGYRATRSATATRTDTALKDVPQSIQVVPREVIEDQQPDNLGDVLANVSSVQRGNAHGGSAESFVVRGFHSSNYAIDGVVTSPLASRSAVPRDLTNIERVEVLKGPASVLYGQGAPGGLINLVTRKPSFTPEAEITATAGSWDYYRLQGNFSGALNEEKTLAGRLAISGLNKDSFRDTFQDTRRRYISPSLRWLASDETLVDLGMEYTDNISQFDRGVIPVDGRITMDRKTYLQEAWSKDENSKLSSWLNVEHQANDWLTLRQSLRYEESRKDRYVTDLRSLDDDGRTLNRRATDGGEERSGVTARFEAEADLATGMIEHTLLGGLEYARYELNSWSDRGSLAPIDIYNPVYGAEPTDFRFNGENWSDADIYSLYLQDQIDLSEQWKLLAGARYDSVKQDIRRLNRDYETSTQEISNSEVSPRLGLVYQPGEGLSLYASYSSSFKPQDDINSSGHALDPETGEQFELGAKFDLVPDKLSATVALFELTRQNVAVEDPNDSEYSIQTGEQRVRGIEFDVTGKPAPGWDIIANLSLLDAELTRDTEYETGNKLQGVPAISGSLWTNYRFSTGRWQGLGLGTGVVFAGKRQGDLANSYEVSGYGRLDARLFYDLNEKVRLSLNAKNLFDREYIETVATTDANYYGAPRSIMASVKVEF